jgi:hypothetical protein
MPQAKMEAEAGALRRAEQAAELSDKQLSSMLKAVSALQQVSLFLSLSLSLSLVHSQGLSISL